MTPLEVSLVARDLFREMRKDRSLEYVIYILPEKGKVLDVERSSRNTDFTSASHFEALVASLPVDKCRYTIYNFRFLTADGGDMHKLVLILWCPHDAAGSERELYAAARSAVRRQMAGISFEVFAQAQEDLDYDEIRRLIDV